MYRLSKWRQVGFIRAEKLFLTLDLTFVGERPILYVLVVLSTEVVVPVRNGRPQG